MSGAQDIPVCAPANFSPRQPEFQAPPGACDCHAHVFGPLDQYPVVSNRVYTPAEASLEQYQHMLKTLRLERAVIVQPSVYGTDNRATLDAVEQGGENYRAVVVVDDSVSKTQLEEFHAQGARGARVNLVFRSNAELDNLKRLANKLAEVGWHMQMLVDVSQFDDIYGFVKQLPVNVVFDHIGHMPTNLGVDHPGFHAMQRLLEEERCWVKLSGSYRITQEETPPYTDVALFARVLVETNPERLVWASDWPHPHIPVAVPNDADLLDMFGDWVGDDVQRQQILVDNPARLYGFE